MIYPKVTSRTSQSPFLDPGPLCVVTLGPVSEKVQQLAIPSEDVWRHLGGKKESILMPKAPAQMGMLVRLKVQ